MNNIIENNINSNLKSNSSLVFIDSQVTDYQGLIPNIEQAEVAILNSDQDGISQITEALKEKQEVSSIHIISHGDVGYLQLGNASLNTDNLANYVDDLEQWSESLSEDADILFYGCDVAADKTGVEFIHQLSNITNADIAASDDLTGNPNLSGDWDLESKTGDIETQSLIIEGYEGVLGDVDINQQVLRLNFDDISGQTAFDTSPSNIQNNGVLRSGTNSQYTQDPDNFQGGIVELSGNNSGIDVANSDEINGASYAERSIVVNFKVDDKNSGRQVIYEEGGGSRGLNIYIDNGQLYVGGWNNNNTGEDWDGTYLSTGNIENGEWNQVVLTLDAITGQSTPQDNAFKAYLNGTEFAQGVGSELLKHANGIGIGNINGATKFHDRTSNGDLGLKGDIGDIQIFNRVLNADEISTLAEGFDGTPTPPPTDENVISTEGQVTLDIAQETLDFNGSNGINIPNSEEINLGVHPKRSIVVDFKVVDKNSGKQVIYEEGGGTRGLNIYIDSGTLYVGGWDLKNSKWSGTFLSTNAIRDNDWHQVVLTLDGIPGSTSLQPNAFKAYLDGAIFAQGDGLELLQHSNGIGIGKINSQTRFFNSVNGSSTLGKESENPYGLTGSIENLQIFNRVLSADEIGILAEGLDENPTLPPDAVDDNFTTDEDTLLSDNVLTNDSNSLTVTQVNGVATDVGKEITLASGALLTLNSDGTFTYNSNGQFEALNDGETGNDSFTYTISDGNGATDTATVNITINGVTQEPTPIVINANNPGFEKGNEDWYFAKTGRANTYGEIRVVENGQSYSGQKQLYLKLPRQAISNYDDQISIGQDLSLSNQKRYAVEVYVKWLNPNNSLPSAIISLWARHPDLETFSGKDFHIVADADGQTEYERLRFEFTPNEDGEVRVWLGLATHIDGLDDTEVYVDNFRIIEIGDALVDKDTRTGNLIDNGDFSQNSDWQITRNNPQNVEGLIQSIESDNLRLELPGTDIPDYLNNTWAGVYQTVKLYEGVTYELSADFDRDVPLNDQTRTIINVYAYRPPTFSDTGELILDEEWIGPIDYDFDCSQPGDTCINDNHRKTFTLTPTETAEYIITFRVFGWANNGVPVKVDIDNVDLRVQR